jgi:hypothetical protein
VRVVLALRTRDQADLVDAVVAYHLAVGVDFVIATDHRSVDGTAEILEGYERRGVVRLLRDVGERITLRRSEMAAMAAAEHDADWVLHCDGDEFWWPRGASVKSILAPVPERYGVVRAAWRHFAPRPEDGRHVLERMTARVSPYGPDTSPADPFHPHVKVAHRARPGLAVTQGAHDVESSAALVTLRSWFPFEILHFPVRSRRQGRAKYEQLRAGLSGGGFERSRHVERAARDIDAGAWDATYRRWLVDDVALEERVADGTVAIDTRLRDALRQIAGVPELAVNGTHYRLPPETVRLDLEHVPSFSEAAAYADDTQPLQDPDAEARVADLERRVGLLPGSS